MQLLEKVVLQDNLSTLVVKLYSRNEGYSLMLKDKNGAGKAIQAISLVITIFNKPGMKTKENRFIHGGEFFVLVKSLQNHTH